MVTRIDIPDGHIEVSRDGYGPLLCHRYVTDHLGSVRTAYLIHPVSGNSVPVQHIRYMPSGAVFGNTKPALQHRLFCGKELQPLHGWNVYDSRARMQYNVLPRFSSPDPLSEKYYHLSPYAYCANDPINMVDPEGRDWYQNEENSYYTWFEDNKDRNGYTHIGGKGSVLGEFESIINNILSGTDGLNVESLYSNGFTFDIAPNDKGGLIASKDRGWDFFDEFVTGTGPEFSVLLENHPYTETLKQEDFVKKNQNIIHSRGRHGNYTNVGRTSFWPWQASLISPMQFIGTYRYDGYSSKDGLYINNVVTDTKSVTSLIYHIKGLSNHRRVKGKEFGTTYQFYIWKTKK